MPGWASRAKQCAEALTQAAALAARRASHSASVNVLLPCSPGMQFSAASVRGGSAVHGSMAEHVRRFSGTSVAQAQAQAVAHAEMLLEGERLHRELLMLEVRAYNVMVLLR